jgi:hypothetical protein
MPSIPQSLLWISLVVLWLFVLVPMLISKRDAVRRTSDVALATRVLNTGRGARLLRRGGPAAGHRWGYSPRKLGPHPPEGQGDDPDWQPSDEGLDDDHDGESHDESAERSVVRVAAVETEVDSEPDYLDVDVVDEASGALPVGESHEAVDEEESDEPQTQPDELPLDFGEESGTEDVQEEDVPEDDEPDGTQASVRVQDLGRGDRAQVQVPQTDADCDDLGDHRGGRGGVHRGASRVVGMRIARRRDDALPGVPASSDTHRGAAAAAPCPADGARKAGCGEHRRSGVRRCPVAAAAPGFSGARDRR